MKERNMNGIVNVLVEGQREPIPVLVADLNAGQKNVIVSENVLEFLTSLLPKANFQEIKGAFVFQLGKVSNMVEYTELLAAELAFHANVNMIRKYYNQEEPAQPEVVEKREAQVR